MRQAISTAFALFTLVIAAFTIVGEPAGAAPTPGILDDQPYVLAAGDIACGDPAVDYPPSPERYVRTDDECHEDATASLFAATGPLAGPNLRAVLPLGDLQYRSGLLSEFTYADEACSIEPPFGLGPCSFDGSWGAALSDQRAVEWRPTPGNHEYSTSFDECRLSRVMASGDASNACGYNDYFGNPTAAPTPERGGDRRGNYTFMYDAETPHPMVFVSLNAGQCQISPARCAPGSNLVDFLQETLRSPETNPPAACAVVYYHQAAWDYYDHGNLATVLPVWQAMLDPSIDASQRPDLVLNGHDHVYERFEPMNADGQTRSQEPSIPQIVVGTGGRDHDISDPLPPNRSDPPAEFDATHFGVESISWSTRQGRIDAAFHREGDPAPFDPVSYRCNGASIPGAGA